MCVCVCVCVCASAGARTLKSDCNYCMYCHSSGTHILGKKFLERRVNNCVTVFPATNFVT